MAWVGTWKNQYGSIIRITDEADGRIAGTFRTVLEDSGLHGQDVPIVGAHRGDCIGFTAAGSGAAGDLVVSYTGLLRDGRMETIWSLVADAVLSALKEGEPATRKHLDWWRAATVNVDTFERLS